MITAALLGVPVAVLLIPIGGGVVEEQLTRAPVPVFDLSGFSDDAPGMPLRFLFIHHSCGGQWLADPGPEEGAQCIYRSYPEGGGLRSRLEQAGYEVHEASYGSLIGHDTDVFDWPPKFQTEMDRILRTDHQDVTYVDDRRNHVVAFKSCFPNNRFVDGASPTDAELAGTPEGPELTVANAKAAYRTLLPQFARHPEVLFVCVTAPPMAPRLRAERLWRRLARTVLGRPSPERKLVRSGGAARRFADWLKSTDGWLRDYTAGNVVVFDLYDILTEEGASNLSRYATQDGYDSHPSRAGFERATQAFLPFLNRAVRKAGLVGRTPDPFFK